MSESVGTEKGENVLEQRQSSVAEKGVLGLWTTVLVGNLLGGERKGAR